MATSVITLDYVERDGDWCHSRGRLACHDKKGRNVRIDAKQDVCFQVIADHDGPLRVEVMTDGMRQVSDQGTRGLPKSASTKRRWQFAKATYDAIIASIICLCGLPTMVGVLLVEYRRGADKDPEP
jgi:hypothetical protein